MIKAKLLKINRYPCLVFILLILIGASQVYGAAPAGFSEYYIPGNEEDILQVLETIGAGSQGNTMHAIITVTAWSDSTEVYYDHWEDGYDFDPDNPTTADETYTIANRGDSRVFESANIPANPRGTATYYDGGDRIYVAGGAATVSRSSWTEANGTTLSVAWEVYPVRPQLTTYILPFGEDLADPGGKNLQDFERVFALIQATNDNTVITVDFEGDGTIDTFDTDEDGDIDGNDETIKTLNAGDSYLLTSDGGRTLVTGAVIKGSSTLQVQYIIGDEGSDYEVRGLSAFPRGFWDDEYYAPVDSANAGDDPTDIYLHNPHDSVLTIKYETTSSSGSFTIDPGESVSFRERTGSYVPLDSAVYLKGDDVFWGISTIDVEATTHDWGYSLVPAFLLENEHFLGWAPGSFPSGAGASADDSGIFIAPAQDNIRVFVDTNNDGSSDQTFDLDRLETQFVYDPTDGDMSEANVWATGPYTIAYGQNPDTSPAAAPAIDVGYTTIPGGGFIERALTVDKATSPTVVSTAAGSQATYTLVVKTYDFEIDNIGVTDTLPSGWQYAAGNNNTTITLADKTTITAASADPAVAGSTLTWSSATLGSMGENQTITIQFTAETTGTFSSGDLTRNIVEARGARTVGGVTQTMVTSDFVFNSYADSSVTPQIDKTTGGADPLSPGDTYTYTVTITNPATATNNLTGISIYDPMPTGVSYVAGSSRVSAPLYYLDELSTQAYNGSDGSLDWSTSPWSEINDDGSATAGYVEVLTDLGDFSIIIEGKSGPAPQRGVVRSADLSAYSEATLSFEYRRLSFDDSTNDYVDVQVRAAGVPSWTTLARITGPATDTVYLPASYGISGHISNNTQIRFINSADTSNSDDFYIDNIRISVTGPPVAAGDAPNFVSKDDEFTLAPDETLTLTFDVTVEDPLPIGIDEIVNTASVTTNEFTLPLSASATNIVVNPSAKSAKVGDRIWLDSDGDGVQDVGETGLTNVKVTLKDRFGTPIATTTTGGNGYYLFTGVAPGSGYYVEVTNGLPAGLQQSAPSGRSDNRTNAFDLAAGDSYTNADLGYKPDSNTATIGDTVWSDADADGIRDAGEPGLAGITVELYSDTNGNGIFDSGIDTLLASTTTGAGGNYLFTGVTATGTEDYLVIVTSPAGYTATTLTTLDFADMTAGDVLIPADFGFQPNAGTAYSINDRVWLDANGDEADAAEAGIAGVTVDLLDASLNVIASTLTDADGYFTFNGVPADGADYTVKITDTNGVLGDYFGTTSWGLTGYKEIDNLNADVSVTPSFGYNLTRSIGDTVFNDLGGSNGIQDSGEPGINGVTVQLYKDDGDGNFEPGTGAGNDGDPVATLTTDTNGKYIFSGLADGTYWVNIDDTQNALSIYDTLTTGDDETASGHQRKVTLAGETSILDLDFGYRASVSYSVSGTIWDDGDGDGVIDAGDESFFEGITVELYLDDGDGVFDSGDTLLVLTSTDASGNYVFSGLKGGGTSYWVRVTDDLGVLSGYEATVDSLRLVSLSTSVSDINFGYRIPLVTLVVLSSFRAYNDDGQVVVEWQTALEIGTLGFYLYRKDSTIEKYLQINESLLPGLLVSRRGGTYRYVDETADPAGTHVYKLVEVESGGKRRKYGPFTVTVDGPGIEFSEKISAKKLSRQIKKFGSLKASNTRMHKRYSKKVHDVSALKKERIKIGKLTKKRAKDLKKLRKGNAAKIAVTESGMYYLDATEIANVLDVTAKKVEKWIRKNKLYMTNQGESVAWLADEDNAGIYFYGQGIDSIYTRENIYWLYKEKGLKMKSTEDEGPDPASGDEAFTQTIHLEEDQWDITHLFDDPNSDYWVWDLADPYYSPIFTFRADGVASAAYTSGEDIEVEAVLTARLIGDAETEGIPTYRVTISINGVSIGNILWEGTSSHEAAIYFDQGLLNDGENEITIMAEDTGAYFVVYIDSFDLTYQRYYRAADDKLLATGDGNETVTIEGFTTSDIRLFDVTNPYSPKLITEASVDEAGIGYRVSFNPVSPGAKYLAVTGISMSLPVSITADVSSKIKQKQNWADYLVIAPAVLKDAAQSLADYRQGQGLESMVVDLEDIMDEFNHGIYSPEAIRDFLSFAYYNWEKAPKYVVLAGKGTYDYKDVLGYGENLMPPLMVATPGGLFPSDNRYADVEGDDGVPEMAVGRLSVVTPEELQTIIVKIMVYESGLNYRDNRVFMLADDPDQGGDFPKDSDDVATLLPPEYTAEKIYLSEHSISDARALVLEGLNTRGPLLVNYIGHAGFDRLASEGLLLIDVVDLIENIEILPVVTAMTCVVGQFSIPGIDSLSEVLVLHDSGGAIAVWSPTGYSENSFARILNEAFFDSAFSSGAKTLGEVILQATKVYSFSGEKQLLGAYNLLGDPALEIWY